MIGKAPFLIFLVVSSVFLQAGTAETETYEFTAEVSRYPPPITQADGHYHQQSVHPEGDLPP